MSKKKQKLWEIQERLTTQELFDLGARGQWQAGGPLREGLGEEPGQIKKEQVFSWDSNLEKASELETCCSGHMRTFVDSVDQHFRNAVGRMAQEASGFCKGRVRGRFAYVQDPDEPRTSHRAFLHKAELAPRRNVCHRPQPASWSAAGVSGVVSFASSPALPLK